MNFLKPMALSLLATIFYGISFAAVEEPLDNRPIYIVGVENISYLPYYDGSVSPTYKGYARDLLDLFALTEGIRFEYRALPLKRLFKEFLVAESLDFKYPDNPRWGTDWSDWKVKNNVTYSRPDIITQTGIATRQGKKIKRFSDCKSLGLIRGFTPQSYISLINNNNTEILHVPTTESLIKSLLGNRVDCIYVSEGVLNFGLKKLGKSGLVSFQSELPVDKQEFSLATVLHPELIESFNNFLVSKGEAILQLRVQYGL